MLSVDNQDVTKYYIKIQEINRGSFGVVYKVKEKKSGKYYAAKVLNSVDDIYKEAIIREIEIMMSVEHPSIIKFHGYFFHDFDKESNYTILMTFAPKGSLADLISLLRKSLADKDFDDTAQQIILVGISSGMMFLHEHKIAHRDLKPENILIDENYYPLIADFGLSKTYQTGRTENSKMCGTMMYIPPEELLNDPTEQHSIEKADVYSFGILMYEFLTLLKPYPELEEHKITQYEFYNRVINNNYRPKFTVRLTDGLEELIERCWSRNIDERPTFEEIFELLSNDEDYFLPCVDKDKLDEYSYQLENSRQKYQTKKIPISIKDSSKTKTRIDKEKSSILRKRDEEYTKSKYETQIEEMKKQIKKLEIEKAENEEKITIQEKTIQEKDRIIMDMNRLPNSVNHSFYNSIKMYQDFTVSTLQKIHSNQFISDPDLSNMFCLYVKDISDKATEKDIMNAFIRFNPVSTKIYDRKIALIKFQNKMDLAYALYNTKTIKLKGKESPVFEAKYFLRSEAIYMKNQKDKSSVPIHIKERRFGRKAPY